ncbi:MAG: DUF4157 domain-containing protein [Nitrospirota bacterium]|nr:DUF4157 domain-containing protein [Nitrospirota bacterium]
MSTIAVSIKRVPDDKREQTIVSSLGHSSKGALSSSTAGGFPLFLQPKLAISQPSDPAELEADHVADQIMRMPEPMVQRQCATCAAGGSSCPACEEEEPVRVSRKAQGVTVGDASASVDSVLRSPGQPLGLSARAFFEPRFGRDLGDVRIHTDQAAQQSAQAVNALAYTVGSHVVFDAGRYAPHSPDGKRLLGHELTHVVQQTGEDASMPSVARKQTDWPAWHQKILQDLISIVSVTAKDSEDVQWRWLQRYLCGLPQDRAQSLHSRWNRGTLAVPGNRDDFPLFVLQHFPVKYDEVIALLDAIGTGNKPASCDFPQPAPDPTPTPEVDEDEDQEDETEEAPDTDEAPEPGYNECDDSTYCTPYPDLKTAQLVKEVVKDNLKTYVFKFLTGEAEELWEAYMSRKPGDDMTPREFRSPDSTLAEKFGDDGLTQDHQESILQNIVANAKKQAIDVYEDKPAFYRVEHLADASLLSTPLEFDDVIGSPNTALTAGGAGGNDRRAVSGMIAIEPSVKNDITNEQNYRITTQLSLWVKDTIDFCPGKCGAWLEQKTLTVPLSRLEATGLVFDVPFEVYADIPTLSYDYLESDLSVRVIT